MLDIYEKKVFSQFGEDGITDYIFTKIDTDTKYYVEIGTQDGSECNTRFLREHREWTGLQIDAKYGQASAHFDGEGDALSLPASKPAIFIGSGLCL